MYDEALTVGKLRRKHVLPLLLEEEGNSHVLNLERFISWEFFCNPESGILFEGSCSVAGTSKFISDWDKILEDYHAFHGV